jgi:oligopeptidase A
MESNPLLRPGELPRFAAIEAAHVEPAVRQLIAAQDAGLAALERDAVPTWDGLVVPLRRLVEPLNFAWGVTGHLMGVKNAPALRAAHEAVLAEVVQSGMRLGQSEPLYRALKQLREREGMRLDAAQVRIVDGLIRDAELAGIGLQGAARERFSALSVELSELGTRFANQLLDATKAFAIELTAPAEVDGLPAAAKAQAAAAARAAGNAAASAEAGPWRITLEGPLFMPFMEHATRRDLRERLYRAFVTRASSAPHDNGPLIARILAARHEQARLLGFADHAALSLAQKMAGRVEAVEKLLAELRVTAKPRAAADLAELTAFARERSGDPALVLRHWDVGFWAERLREHRYAFSDEQLRPYFALPKVLDGLFALARRLFGVDIRAADGEAEVWHPDVRFFRVHDDAGRPIAAFFLDPYSRPAEKRGGAWMDVCLDRVRRADGSVRQPVAYLVCNQTPPVDAAPSLMTFREVETLFHEFGHGLQHLLTTVDQPECAGINRVEWDAVELPSQFMENWCLHEGTLRGFARHWQTGEALPAEFIAKLRAARTYRAGSMFMRQIYFSTIDIELHRLADPAGLEALVAKVEAENTVLPPLPEDRFLCGFSHIFAGGYAAGYYSYKWAEVLSADAFGAFEEAGLDDPDAVARVGRRFRDTVLALGGSRHPAEVYRAFRGRDPSTAALLRHNGLAA